ncbi:putative mitochondrial ATP-binding cassette protein subfamily B, member 3 [Leptomonas pyrrhocoris]|uniref:Putative mitochondrial ATP-binding cassette protein subfamily B, member 3 n=1 Tax=Leptomonas pyrrhocoris TaxID=157538 RepID=A0A0N0DZ98_LEPPY|nr:putative mitochondrial ATP-binding cassette protein subfamily B, member 3 [Leptomonas pyrrhocoris]KPA84942.1 putative mitochondrial ATP-binding cassette protein subfamily B, member 3 [Leptomonas pyrrhocoris]|eukprot:XP_015663381.1 putative mitochondrial ATP-binding cassette protein subfamily B, member 3 [Leptomonas pyrrhocoris]
MLRCGRTLLRRAAAGVSHRGSGMRPISLHLWSVTTAYRTRRGAPVLHGAVGGDTFSLSPSSSSFLSSSTYVAARTFVWPSWLLRAPSAKPPAEDEKKKRFRESTGAAFEVGSTPPSFDATQSKLTEAKWKAASTTTDAAKKQKEEAASKSEGEEASPTADGARGTFVRLSNNETEVIHRVNMGERVEAATKELKERQSSDTKSTPSVAAASTDGSSAQSKEGGADSRTQALQDPNNGGSKAGTSPSGSPPAKASDKAPPLISTPPRQDGIHISENASDIPVGRVVGKVWSYLWPRGEPKIKALVAGSVFCVLLAKVLKVAVPFWFKTIVDLLAPATATAEAATVAGPFVIGVFGCVVAYGICRITTSITEELKTLLFAPVGGHASTKLAMEMFDKLHQLDLNYHLNRETGVISKDLDRGSRAFWSLAYALLFMVVPTTFEMGLVCCALNTQAGPQFIGIALVAVVAYVSWTFLVTNWRAKFRTRYNALDSRCGGLIVDSLLNYETVKYFGTETYESQRIRTETTNMNNQLVILDQTMAVLNFGQQVIFVTAGVLSLYFATCGVLAGALTVGDLVLVDALLMQLYMPLSYLGMIYREVQTSTQNMQAMIALLDKSPNVNNKTDAKEYKYIDGTIELRDVSFEYKKELNRLVLRHLSLTIPGGKTVAFVGPSGSGKSTIFRLLFRFYDPTAGQVLLDGQPLDTLKMKSVRKYIGVIPQDTVLFNESVRYNIRYGRMNATDEEVEAAAKAASLHDTVMHMSNGYATSVGERGLKLSGGEKQRVSIARVVLADPPILLADEATSALDSTTELNVMDTLKSATGRTRPRTIILIAHRLTTVKEADIIFVLDGKGGVGEQGTHAELLRKGGLYSEMWLQQLRDRHRAGGDGSEKTPSEADPQQCSQGEKQQQSAH